MPIRPPGSTAQGQYRTTEHLRPAPAATRYLPPAGISLLLAGGTIWLGRQVREEPITERLVISGGFVVLTIAYINLFSHAFANAFALLLFIAVVLNYGLDILTHTGLRGE